MTSRPITFISSHAALGGSELYLEWLLDRLGPGWTPTVMCLEDGPFAQRMRARGVPVEIVRTGRRLGIATGAARLARGLRRHPPAVIHANGVKAALVAVLARPRAPIVWVKHDFSWDGPLVRLIAARCRRVVAVSHAVGAPLAAAGVDVTVVHNGIPEPDIDGDRGRRTARALAGGGSGPLLALVGRLDAVKGQLELVEAMPELLVRAPGLRALLIGDAGRRTGYAERVRRRIAELGLGEVVRLTGPRQDALEILAGCDVTAVLGLPDERGMGREGFGLVAVEAMAVGTPVVAYAAGALPEVVADGGVLVPAGDRRGLVEAVARVLAEPGLAAEICARGHARARQEFRIEQTVAAMRTVYAEVTGRSAMR